MNQQWAVRMCPEDIASLGRLRLRPGLEVCEHPGAVWLAIKQPRQNDQLDAAVLALPGRRFEVLSDRQLVPYGRHVPTGYLPEGPWHCLSEWLAVNLQPAGFSGQIAERTALQLVRGGTPAEANLVVSTAQAWRDYAAAAPQVRLNRLAFAMNGCGEAVIRGTPLPPLSGARFVASCGVAVPAGWTWSPAVDAETVRAVLGLADQDLALLRPDGTWDHIRQDDFVRATRSAVEMSTEPTL